MKDIKWGAPPEKRQGIARDGKWHAVAESLRSRPGEWAMVSGDAGVLASYVTLAKTGGLSGFTAGEFEATGRKREDGRFDLYVRYIGEVSA